MLAPGSSKPDGPAGGVSVTSASSPTDTPAGIASKATSAARSSVTLSLTSSTRTTLPGTAWPGLERSTICAGRPAASPLERPWSMRTRSHRLAGSMSLSTACPAITVLPGSASRAVTTPAAGASRRSLRRCPANPSRSELRRVMSCRAAARPASAACRPAWADTCSCSFASTTPALTKWLAPSST